MGMMDEIKPVSPVTSMETGGSRFLTSETVDTTKVVALAEGKTSESIDAENLKYQGLVSYVAGRYQRAKDYRREAEQRWLLAFNNYRGYYSPDVQFLEHEKSRVFMKITKTKVLASYAQISDILFSSSKYPIGIEPSRDVEGVLEAVHFDPQSPENKAKQQGGPGGGQGQPQTKSTVARPDILAKLGPVAGKTEPVHDMLKEGPGLTPTAYTWEPAKEAALNLDALIQDQLDESDAVKKLQLTIFEMCLLGHGVQKGPFAVEREYPKWDESGKYTPTIRTMGAIDHVSVWNFYPDPDARTIEDCEYVIERHKMSRSQLRALKRRPHFRSESIEKAIEGGSSYIREYWENEIEDSTIQPSVERYEVFEFWGMMDHDIAKDAGLEIPENMAKHDTIQVNAWICNGKIIRLVLNPFTPMRIPYQAAPYELNPYSFFGVGVAENMDDTQLLMNGFMRLAIDNAVLSSNIIFEVDETNLAPGQSMEMYPGKIIRKQGGAPGQSLFATKFPNVTQECLAMFDKARQLADEATGMPSYAHGVSGVMGVGRTASGMSMLMGAAKENIKAVVSNIDSYILVPQGKGFYAFNMQFNFDKKYVGDVSVVARGTESLMRNEIRSQKLLQMLQLTTSNPQLAPYAKIDYLLREYAASIDLEPDKVVNDPREAAIQAKVMADMQKIMGVQPGQGQGQQPSQDPTGNGGGQIQPGAAPNPGQPGFAGGGGGANSPPPPKAGGPGQAGSNIPG